MLNPPFGPRGRPREWRPGFAVRRGAQGPGAGSHPPVRAVGDVCVTSIASVSPGDNFDLMRRYLNLLPVRRDWYGMAKEPLEVIIDSTFYVPGVGTVVGGIVTSGVLQSNDTVWLGPNANGHFRQVCVVWGVCTGAWPAEAAAPRADEGRGAFKSGEVIPPQSFA